MGSAAKLAPGAAFIGAVVVVVVALFLWRDSRVELIVESAKRGDVVTVGTDVCVALKERGLVEADADCGYRDSVEVRLIKDPE
jgi:hypothetical protein